MLEWKFRLVVLVSLAAMIAAASGILPCIHNFNW